MKNALLPGIPAALAVGAIISTSSVGVLRLAVLNVLDERSSDDRKEAATMLVKDRGHQTTGSGARALFRRPRAVLATDLEVFAWMRSRPTSAEFDNAMIGLSSLADHGKLWAAASVALAVTGHRSAAMHGMLSLGIASASANIIGKQLFGGTRPPASHVPHRRKLPQTPTSATFPSGHTASAFAFAVGASIEDRRLAVVLLPLAAAVAYSRMHTGAHWFSDVLGGALLGTTAAVVEAALHRRQQSRARSRTAAE